MGTFQVILYEGSNNIRIQYRDLLGGDRALGNSATIGIKQDNSTYLQYSSNTASLTQGQSILYTHDGNNNYTASTSASYELVYLAPAGAPTSPTLVNPTDGTTGVTLTPTFEWLAVDSATSYTVLISTVANFSSTVVNQSGITGTSYTLGSALSQNTNYYWRVQAVNSIGSSLSPTRSFTTGTPNNAPDTPTNITSSTMTGGSINSDITGDTLTATLTDSDIGNQVRYRIQIATDGSFNDLVVDYRSPFAAQGSATYTYGETGGTYLIGNATTTLSPDDYYVRIRAEDQAAASSAWYTVSGVAFTIAADENPPGISGLSTSPESNSVEIVWSTDEAASSQVNYGPSPGYASSTSITDTSPRVTSHSVTLTGLRPCVEYSFRVRSKDASNNETVGNVLSFTTKGCTGLATVSAQTASLVSTSTGGTMSLSSGGKEISLRIPANFSSSTANFQIKKVDESRVIASTSKPTGYMLAGDNVYTLHAVEDSFGTISTFDNDISITLNYTSADVDGIDENTLKIYRWDDEEEDWVALSNCSVDKTAKTVTCDTNHFSTFSLFGVAAVVVSVAENPRKSNPDSIKSRVSRLYSMGKEEEADSLKRDWPKLFPDINNSAEVIVAISEMPTVVSSTTEPVIVKENITIRDLQSGDSGDDVLALQKFLNKQGFILINAGPGSPGNETNFFGPLTWQSLVKFQKANNVSPSIGYFGPITRAKIKSLGL